MRVPQQTNRTLLYQLCIRAVVTDEGLYYDDLVDTLAFNVSNEDAHARIEQRRRRAVSETDERAIASGKRYWARAIIDRAHRYGRITYLDQGTASRTVWLGSPPTGGGPHGVTRTWDDERTASAGEAARVLDRTRAQLG